MLQSTYLWSVAGLLIFFAILARFGVHRMVMSALDKRGETIAAELAEAKKLREDAQKLLTEYQARRQAAEAEAEAIVSAARDEAEQLARDAEAKVTEFVARRTRTAEQKIAQAEAQAAADVRAAAADAASAAAEQILRRQMGGAGGAGILSAGLTRLKGQLN